MVGRPGVSVALAAASWRPKPRGLRSAIGAARAFHAVTRIVDRSGRGSGGEVAEPLHPGKDPTLAIVEPLLDVEREDVPTAGRSDAERDGDRVVGLVADRDRDALHAELLGAPRGATVEPDRGLSGRESLDLD